MLLVAAPAFAAQLRSGERAGLARGEVIDEDLYVAGANVVVSGVVHGDVIAAGGDVLVDGTVDGSVIAAGGTVTVQGRVGHAVRAAGGEVRIGGRVQRDVVIAGGDLVADAAVAGDLIAAGATLQTGGLVAGRALLRGTELAFGSRVRGSVDLEGQRVTVQPGATVGGVLSVAGDRVRIDPSATYARLDRRPGPGGALQANPVLAALATTLLFGLVALVTGLALLALLPTAGGRVAQELRGRPWRSLGAGTVAAFAAPLLVVVLLISVLGVPLALLIAVFVTAGLYLGHLVAASVLGEVLLARRRPRPRTLGALLASLALGLALLYLVALIPFAGWLALLVAALAGLGALVLALLRHRGRLERRVPVGPHEPVAPGAVRPLATT